MKRWLVSGWLVLALSLAGGGSAAAMRCGNDLVLVGERKLEVLKSCGEPDFVDTWEERRRERIYYFGHWYPDYRLVVVEEWTYNFGPSLFMRTLTFENGRLVEIETGDYGF
ncbi:hypothetical protein DESUT3_09680 [Desulfuromonas versatilis]|uniref:DUF2845 domain-containing protein n=1 Tax=Desulfuromonas versatilis TaxID=2802975 RepID=A0ABM8HTU7_9BACT|nr:DUF2845 domain-containing protein [Desulfuromonas versatilis]BCR03899.1 hypothetical protein DESUT3_09680 [Desulfuromonas versatilis]